jgi:hypothetical protein
VGAAFGGCCQPWRSAVSRVVERIGRAKELDALIMIFERQLGDELVWAGQHLDERSRVPLMGKGLEGAQVVVPIPGGDDDTSPLRSDRTALMSSSHSLDATISRQRRRRDHLDDEVGRTFHAPIRCEPVPA